MMMPHPSQLPPVHPMHQGPPLQQAPPSVQSQQQQQQQSSNRQSASLVSIRSRKHLLLILRILKTLLFFIETKLYIEIYASWTY